MIEPLMLVGLGVVAVWVYVRYPRLRPASFLLMAAHVAVSFAGFALLPTGLDVIVPLLHSPALRLCIGLALLIIMLTYVLVSWVWLIAGILQKLGGTPRGGHPVSNEP